jgi:hypothetical protein
METCMVVMPLRLFQRQESIVPSFPESSDSAPAE